MSSMSYCRFQNTLTDLEDCLDSIIENDINDLSEGEAKARERLIEVCRDIIAEAD